MADNEIELELDRDHIKNQLICDGRYASKKEQKDFAKQQQTTLWIVFAFLCSCFGASVTWGVNYAINNTQTVSTLQAKMNTVEKMDSKIDSLMRKK